MNCDSFNEPGYEQSSCSPYISRNSCCFARVFDFFFFLFCTVAAGRRDSCHTKPAWPIVASMRSIEKLYIRSTFLYILKYWGIMISLKQISVFILLVAFEMIGSTDIVIMTVWIRCGSNSATPTKLWLARAWKKLD